MFNIVLACVSLVIFNYLAMRVLSGCLFPRICKNVNLVLQF